LAWQSKRQQLDGENMMAKLGIKPTLIENKLILFWKKGENRCKKFKKKG